MNNIHTVDTIVKSAESAIENFYGNDGRTAYLFTADHGMSVMGNHGDGRTSPSFASMSSIGCWVLTILDRPG